MPPAATEWRLVDGVVTAWFPAASLSQAGALAGRIADLPDCAVDVRTVGVRVRLASTEHTQVVSSAARQLGLAGDPTMLQQVSIVVDSGAPATVRTFWQRVLGYAEGDGGIVDPLRRDPAIRIAQSTAARPLRNRIHLDVVRPAAVVAATDAGAPSGPYGVCHRDPDGNEVDLVPGDALGDAAAVADWHAVFSAVACYRTTTTEQQRDLVATAAALADAAGFPLLIDARPGLVVLDSGKDQWEADTHGLDVDFADLAGRLQAAARELGAAADPELPRFVQLFLDAADVATIRDCWAAALGYLPDRRPGVTDLHDPRRLNPVVVFQELDLAETERRRQRNRVHVELAVPADAAPGRVAAAVAAGARLVDTSEGRWWLADPEGNELVVVA